MKKRTTKKRRNKKGPSKWIMHVKAYCKKTGKTFPEALKDPMCKKSFKNQNNNLKVLDLQENPHNYYIFYKYAQN